jgi:hypothetical protein
MNAFVKVCAVVFFMATGAFKSNSSMDLKANFWDMVIDLREVYPRTIDNGSLANGHEWTLMIGIMQDINEDLVENFSQDTLDKIRDLTLLANAYYRNSQIQEASFLYGFLVAYTNAVQPLYMLATLYTQNGERHLQDGNPEAGSQFLAAASLLQFVLDNFSKEEFPDLYNTVPCLSSENVKNLVNMTERLRYADV